MLVVRHQSEYCDNCVSPVYKEFPQIFFDLIGKTETNLNSYEFIAPEIKQTSFRLDGVLSPLKIVVYKFPNLSREEIEAMFNFNIIKDTKVYQEAKEEGKLEVVPKLIKEGFTIQKIAEMLEIDVETVRKVAKAP